VSVAPRAATSEEILAVHAPEHRARVERVRGRAASFDPDTQVSAKSVEAAYLAAGGTIALCERVARGADPPGIALVRPPGHHASADGVMGFCLFNNIAIAARALLDRGYAERVAIYDWDVHHGNGTQAVFYDDDRVLYGSTHQWPYYPGTGSIDERGRGRGEGFTVNAPLSAGANDEALLAVTRELLGPRVRDFAPDVILISAGFDAYIDDPLGGLCITLEGFRTLASLWRELADEVAGGRIAAVLEGGYDTTGLAACVVGLLEAWDT
jgi:acetoin utilization deacetylase AcuC-like enzyme